MLSDYMGLALRLVRKKAGKTQEEVAKALEKELKKLVGQSYISKIETSSEVSFKRLEIICRFLNCKVSYLIRLAEILQNKKIPILYRKRTKIYTSK